MEERNSSNFERVEFIALHPSFCCYIFASLIYDPPLCSWDTGENIYDWLAFDSLERYRRTGFYSWYFGRLLDK
jgi:hypothetical protein